jgi:uroporphyrinogen decarboxylase
MGHRGDREGECVVNPKLRTLNAVRRVRQDGLPIQLDVTDRALWELGTRLGFVVSEDAQFNVLRQHLVFARPGVSRRTVDPSVSGTDIDAWGVPWATDQEGVWVREHPLAMLPDLRAWRAPDVSTGGAWGDVAATVRRYGREFCVVGYQNALLFERAWALRGFERLLLDVADDLSGVEAFCDAIIAEQIRVAERFVSLGIDVARTGDDWGGQQGMLFAPQVWRRLIRPRLQAVWQVYQAHGIPIIHHSCGDIRPILGDLVDLGLDVLHPVQPEAMPLEEIAQRYGSHLSFYGGISEQKVLPFGTPEDITAEVRRCVDLLGKHGGYIIAPSQAIMSDVPPANVRALLDAMVMYCDAKG